MFTTHNINIIGSFKNVSSSLRKKLAFSSQLTQSMFMSLESSEEEKKKPERKYRKLDTGIAEGATEEGTNHSLFPIRLPGDPQVATP